MEQRLKLILYVLAACFAVSSASAAQMRLVASDESCSNNGIQVRGQIERGDANQLATNIRAMQDQVKPLFGECFFPPVVSLDSDGGDVHEALQMGAIVRDAGLATDVLPRGNCFSSCVFVFAAGVDRKVWRGARIGIHRPFVSDLKQGTPVQAIRRQRGELLDRIRAYFEQLDVSTQLLDAMLAVPADEIRVLDDSEMRAFRIIGRDAAFEEYQVKWNATMFDLPSAEFRRRNVTAQEKCAHEYELNICVSAVILDITMPESKRRWARYLDCKKKTRSELEQRDCFLKFVTRAQRTRP